MGTEALVAWRTKQRAHTSGGSGAASPKDFFLNLTNYMDMLRP